MNLKKNKKAHGILGSAKIPPGSISLRLEDGGDGFPWRETTRSSYSSTVEKERGPEEEVNSLSCAGL